MKGEIARENFKNGLNCAQAVALAFKNELNLSEEQIKWFKKLSFCKQNLLKKSLQSAQSPLLAGFKIKKG